MRITFRKGRTYSGQMRLAETYRIIAGRIEVGVVQKLGRDRDLWFWYTLDKSEQSVNTVHSPAPLENVKAAVKEWFRNCGKTEKL